MSSFNPAPTVILPPTPDRYFVNSHCIASTRGPVINGISPNGLASSHPKPCAATRPTLDSIAGRKRSRGDMYAHNGEEDDEHLDDGSVPTHSDEQPQIPRGQPVYGPGMTILYPADPGYTLCAESQSGTWVEERAVRGRFGVSHAKRPSMTSRKSQRLDARASGPDDIAQLVLPPQMRDVTNEPLIDEATRSLGISWARMDSTEALLINQAAYSKFIQNYYPALKNVTVWFENSALPGYLVAATNAYNGQHEYYIFSHDLAEGRLVTNEPSQLLPRLKMLPALHLAAPGVHIRAEKMPITASLSTPNETDEAHGTSGATHESKPSGACAAHAMELD